MVSKERRSNSVILHERTAVVVYICGQGVHIAPCRLINSSKCIQLFSQLMFSMNKAEKSNTSAKGCWELL